MDLYHFNCYGRQRGALGIFHNFSTFVAAETFEEAKLKLYDNWEHISIKSYDVGPLVRPQDNVEAK